MADVTIYSTPTCGYCNMAKDYFAKNNIEYMEIDVSQDQKAAEEIVEKTGQMGVPVIIIKKDDKEEVLVGFDQSQLADMLGIV